MTDSIKNDTLDPNPGKPALQVRFYASASGREPVREWLRSLADEDRKSMGRCIKKAQFGWPIGYPLVRKMEDGLWEIRGPVLDGIARIFFTVDGGWVVLLHGFLKRSQATPGHGLEFARRRSRNCRGSMT